MADRTSVAQLIEKKKHGGALAPEEIQTFVDGLMSGSISDAQAVALMMAVWFVGMTEAETTALTLAMARSGETLDLSPLGRCVDKHSSGGVGDKTTLIAAPLAAAAGARVVKLSGRGLGHTGGTLDKLESIRGFRTDLSADEFRRAAASGLVIAGQSADLAPADKRLYALRDVTGTIDSIPLIAASIMSKKLAAGAHGIVLDVKCGRGAFMPDREGAERLARLMVRIGTDAGRAMAAAVTRMDAPLGRAIGNALEVKEAIATLRGDGPEDLTRLSVALAAKMVEMGCEGLDAERATAHVREALASGAGLAALRGMVARQGGDARCIDDPERLPAAPIRLSACAKGDGFVREIDARCIGEACLLVGAGRTRKEDAVDHAAGVMLLRQVGGKVSSGEPVAEIHAADAGAAERAVAIVAEAFVLGSAVEVGEPILAWFP